MGWPVIASLTNLPETGTDREIIGWTLVNTILIVTRPTYGVHLPARHLLVYMPRPSGIRCPGDENMRRSTKIFMNNRNQAVRLPKEFQFNTREVFIRKEGNDVILSPRPTDWLSYLTNGPVASEAFMQGVEDLPVQEREP